MKFLKNPQTTIEFFFKMKVHSADLNSVDTSLLFYFKGVAAATAAAKSLQSCLTLRDPIDSSPPGSLPLGFSRREYWSGVPLPSPTYSVKWDQKSIAWGDQMRK